MPRSRPAAPFRERLGFALSTAARVAFYGGTGLAMRRLVARDRARAGVAPIDKPERPIAGWPRLLEGITDLMRRDFANVSSGVYPVPDDRDPDGLSGLIDKTRRFMADVPRVERRRREGAHQEVNTPDHEGLPRYYRQNFHFQTDGWLSDESARLYDTQVEVLFTGSTAAMRRQALVPMAEVLRQYDQRKIAYADLATGTGALLVDVARAFPRLKINAVDLSEPYLAFARARVPGLRPINAPAEHLPFADASLDLITSVYLFHELPPKIRRAVATEVARVLKPGGTFILVDSLQTGDEPDFDGLLDLFPRMFHEPYFTSYLAEDFGAVFGGEGVELVSSTNAFLSKVMVFRRR